jgi:hypothetical protein
VRTASAYGDRLESRNRRVRSDDCVIVDGPGWESWENGENEASWSRMVSRSDMVRLDF